MTSPPATRYRLVIFDFDGTLADSFPWFSRTVNEVADRYRFRRIATDEVDLLRTMDARSLMRHLGIAWWKMPLIARHMRRRKARELDATRLFAGVDRMLERLADAGMLLALVSSNAEANVRAILGADNVARIRWLECGTALFGKAARFRKVLRQSGVAAADAICIGDEIRDIEAARRHQIAFGAVAWGYTAADALAAHRPAFMFRSVDEIGDRLTGGGSP